MLPNCSRLLVGDAWISAADAEGLQKELILVVESCNGKFRPKSCPKGCKTQQMVSIRFTRTSAIHSEQLGLLHSWIRHVTELALKFIARQWDAKDLIDTYEDVSTLLSQQAKCQKKILLRIQAGGYV